MQNNNNNPDTQPAADKPKEKGIVAQVISLAVSAPLGIALIADGAAAANLRTVALGASLAIAGTVVAVAIGLYAHVSR